MEDGLEKGFGIEEEKEAPLLFPSFLTSVGGGEGEETKLYRLLLPLFSHINSFFSLPLEQPFSLGAVGGGGRGREGGRAVVSVSHSPLLLSGLLPPPLSLLRPWDREREARALFLPPPSLMPLVGRSVFPDRVIPEEKK